MRYLPLVLFSRGIISYSKSVYCKTVVDYSFHDSGLRSEGHHAQVVFVVYDQTHGNTNTCHYTEAVAAKTKVVIFNIAMGLVGTDDNTIFLIVASIY